jgi:hypothetical protein
MPAGLNFLIPFKYTNGITFHFPNLEVSEYTVNFAEIYPFLWMFCTDNASQTLTETEREGVILGYQLISILIFTSILKKRVDTVVYNVSNSLESCYLLMLVATVPV